MDCCENSCDNCCCPNVKIIEKIYYPAFISPTADATGTSGSKGKCCKCKAAAAVQDVTCQTQLITQFNLLLKNLRAAGLLEK